MTPVIPPEPVVADLANPAGWTEHLDLVLSQSTSDRLPNAPIVRAELLTDSYKLYYVLTTLGPKPMRRFARGLHFPDVAPKITHGYYTLSPVPPAGQIVKRVNRNILCVFEPVWNVAGILVVELGCPHDYGENMNARYSTYNEYRCKLCGYHSAVDSSG